MRPCCKDWTYAITAELVKQEGSEFYIASGEWVIHYCPFCGASKAPKSDLEIAAQNVVEALGGHKEWDDLKEAIGELAGVLERKDK